MKNNLGIKDTNKDNQISQNENSSATLSIANLATKCITVASPIKNTKNNYLNSLLISDASHLTSTNISSVSHLINIQTSVSANNNAASSSTIFGTVQNSFLGNKNNKIYLSQKQPISTMINTSIQNSLISQSGGTIHPAIISYNLVNKQILNNNNHNNGNTISQPMLQQNNISNYSQASVNTYFITSSVSPANTVKSVPNMSSQQQCSLLTTGINNNHSQNYIKQLVTSSSTSYLSASHSIVPTISNALSNVNSGNIVLANTQGTLLRGNTRHILACNVANRNQCLITTAVPMRALQIQSPLNHLNKFTPVNNANSSVNQTSSLEQANQVLASDRQQKLTNNISKVEVVRNINPRAMNVLSIQNRPYVAQSIKLANSTVARIPIRPVEIRHLNADDTNKVLLLSGDNLDSRISGQNLNFDNKILLSTGSNIYNFDTKMIGEQMINADIKSETRLNDVKPLIQINSELKSTPQNVVHFECGKILTGQNIINLSDGNLFTDQIMSRVINQASSGDGGMIVVSQNIGQQFTALQNKGMVMSGLKLPAYIDLRQVSTANDSNSRAKAIPTKNNRPTFNPCSNRSKDPNTRSQMNEKDSQELERVMDILKHYKQQISCHDQVTAHFLQPCKRKRSKPGESMVGALTTTNNNCQGESSYNVHQSSNITNHLDNNSILKTTHHTKLYTNINVTTASLSYNTNSIMASLSTGLLSTSLNNNIFGSTINSNLLGTSLNSNLTGVSGGLMRPQTSDMQIGVSYSNSSPRLLAFRPSLVSLLQQPIAKIFSLDETNLKGDELLIKSNIESKENLSNNVEIKEHIISNDFFTCNDNHINIEDDEDDGAMSYNIPIVGDVICKDHGIEIVKEFISKSFNLKLEEVKICIIVNCKMNSEQKPSKDFKMNKNLQFVKTSSEKLICFFEELNSVDGSCHLVDKCNCQISLSLFGLFISKDLNYALNQNTCDIFKQYDCSFEKSENINYNSFEDYFKQQAEILASKLYGNHTKNWSNVTFTKQEVIDDQNCIILSINNKSNPVQYITIPNYTLTNPEVFQMKDHLNNKNSTFIKDSSYTNNNSTINNNEPSCNHSFFAEQDLVENCFFSNKKDIDNCIKIDTNETKIDSNNLELNESDLKEMNKNLCVNYISNEHHETSYTNEVSDSGQKKIILSTNKIVTRASRNSIKTNDEKNESKINKTNSYKEQNIEVDEISNSVNFKKHKIQESHINSQSNFDKNKICTRATAKTISPININKPLTRSSKITEFKQGDIINSNIESEIKIEHKIKNIENISNNDPKNKNKLTNLLKDKDKNFSVENYSNSQDTNFLDKNHEKTISKKTYLKNESLQSNYINHETDQTTILNEYANSTNMVDKSMATFREIFKNNDSKVNNTDIRIENTGRDNIINNISNINDDHSEMGFINVNKDINIFFNDKTYMNNINKTINIENCKDIEEYKNIDENLVLEGILNKEVDSSLTQNDVIMEMDQGSMFIKCSNSYIKTNMYLKSEDAVFARININDNNIKVNLKRHLLLHKLNAKKIKLDTETTLSKSWNSRNYIFANWQMFNSANTMTTNTMVTKWIKPKLTTSGPYQCWC